MDPLTRPFAIVTGASSGLGFELAACCARSGFDLLVASSAGTIHDAAQALGRMGTRVYAVRADLAQPHGPQAVLAAALGRTPDALLINTREAESHANEEWAYERQGTDDRSTAGILSLVHGVGQEMRLRGRGRILLAGSSDDRGVHTSFFDAFAFALRHELRGSGVNLTSMFPNANEITPSEGAVSIARAGFDAMMRGQDDVPAGRASRTRVSFGRRQAADGLAEVHPIAAAK